MQHVYVLLFDDGLNGKIGVAGVFSTLEACFHPIKDLTIGEMQEHIRTFNKSYKKEVTFSIGAKRDERIRPVYTISHHKIAGDL